MRDLVPSLKYGVGTNDYTYPTRRQGKDSKEYRLWNGMLARCYSKVALARGPSYLNCRVSENFKDYTYFYQWCQNQIGFDTPNYQLDKDLICKGNRVYSEDTCVFLPQVLNNLLIKRSGDRGNLPIGVCANCGGFQTKVNIRGASKHLGTFPTPDLAFQAYKTAKEAHIKDMADLYKANIDPRAYAALMAYQVEITD